MELLYVDDLVLIGETKELLLLLKKVRQWKEWMEKSVLGGFMKDIVASQEG
mgnify:CR=1 FL=1